MTRSNQQPIGTITLAPSATDYFDFDFGREGMRDCVFYITISYPAGTNASLTGCTFTVLEGYGSPAGNEYQRYATVVNYKGDTEYFPHTWFKVGTGFSSGTYESTGENRTSELSVIPTNQGGATSKMDKVEMVVEEIGKLVRCKFTNNDPTKTATVNIIAVI